MSEMKPTPGPWSFYTDPQPNGCPIVGNDKGLMVAMVAHSVLFLNQEQAALSDARLIAEAGTVFHNTGLSPVQLVEMVKELKAALRKYEDVREDMFTFFLSNGIFNQWGKRYDCSALNNAHLQARAALAKCEGVKP